MSLRPGQLLVADAIRAGARVLDVGCGDGALLAHLRDAKGCDGRGVEIDSANVAVAVARGLSVVQADAGRDLADFPSGSVDYAVLSETLQAMAEPVRVLDELLRIGRHAIVTFPNFGHWRVRWHLLGRGRMPMTAALPVMWYESANIHFCTVADFRDLISAKALTVEREAYLAGERPVARGVANWRADWAMFVLRR